MAKEKKRAMQISRRQFVKGAVVGAAAVTAAGTVGALSSCGGPGEVGIPDKWDKEVDVVVVGTGTVNAAALVAEDAGLEVLMLEKGQVFGGTTAVSGGALYIPNNYLMQEDGVTIQPRAEVINYIRAQAFGQSTEELMSAFVDNGSEMLEWFRDNAWGSGVAWGRSDSPPKPKSAGYFPFADAPKYGSSVSIRREDETGGGGGLIKSCREAVDAAGIEVMLETPAKRLIYKGSSAAGDGEVVGVIAEDPNGQEIAIKARYGVCLGTGGFDHNKEMVRHFLRGPLYLTCGVPPTNTGDGHLMAMAVGADLRNMNECWGLCGYIEDRDPSDVEPPDTLPLGYPDWFVWRSKPGAIVVNRYGERIGNESTSYESFGRSFHTWDNGNFEWRNIPAFTIWDSLYTQFHRFPGPYPGADIGVVPNWVTGPDTIDGLSAQLGIDADGLKRTLEVFNENAKNGIDPIWHRGEHDYDNYTGGDRSRTDLAQPTQGENFCLAPLETPPYYGAALWPSALGTNGGPRTNGNAQVLNVFGQVIPRLYASGNLMASCMGAGYAHGGGTLGPGFTFGYLAGKHVATLASW